ncbi:MAG: HNH endonuclease, partial [Anaerolineae bacterium]|nr:HNH endonuclease [Anaerolineae bacterium]
MGAEFTIDHIVPQALGGSSDEDNLCLACWRCNLLKRDRIAAIDPETGVTVRLFNPRIQNWFDHFVWQEDGLVIA